jgi:hypothetical protein
VPVTVALPANAAVGDVITVSIDASAPISYTVLASKLTTLSASVLIPTADIVAAGQGGALLPPLIRMQPAMRRAQRRI